MIEIDEKNLDLYMQKAIATILKSNEIESISKQGLELLSIVVKTRLIDQCVYIRELSELAGRSKPNVNDISQCLNSCNLSVSGLGSYLRKLKNNELSQEIKVEHARGKKVPERFTKNDELLKKMILKNGNSSKKLWNPIPPSHIPEFLGNLPSKHTYKQTFEDIGSIETFFPENSQFAAHKLKAEQRLLAENSLENLESITENGVSSTTLLFKDDTSMDIDTMEKPLDKNIQCIDDKKLVENSHENQGNPEKVDTSSTVLVNQSEKLENNIEELDINSKQNQTKKDANINEDGVKSNTTVNTSKSVEITIETLGTMYPAANYLHFSNNYGKSKLCNPQNI
ncbi:hypothetical protein BB559_005151 [Furculomyces boomerangus]|uniref:Transcription initiation factor TFIID subunit 8 n=2 Tax=Harpellales TaxID=61421 RepID=A0A2T9YAE8_9FUNG|nr:hypothetical protein BB559_005151 [Furculomyces boomerangus]PVZ97732.1 hypothetical protein BB558_006310 [Smittium angustum]